MRSQTIAQNPRRILCVFPRYTPSFGTFEHAYKLMGVRAFMPPQGLLVVAAYLPESWPVRFVDESSRRATADELAWADAVFVSGMHIQRPHIHDIVRRAHRFHRPVVVGGPAPVPVRVQAASPGLRQNGVGGLGAISGAGGRLNTRHSRHRGPGPQPSGEPGKVFP